jgi:DNA-binding Lrp family transcriptional regulator
MDAQTLVTTTRRPRFCRASEPPAFRLTDDDVHIVRQLARHRFLKSTHIAALVGRSLDRTNDRLLRLFHAGYIDRPRAQLDYYPTAGSSPIAYALADRGARLLIQRDGIEFANVEWSRKNRRAGRPFIEHQLEIVDFSVALQLATGARRDVQFIHP